LIGPDHTQLIKITRGSPRNGLRTLAYIQADWRRGALIRKRFSTGAG